MGKRIYEVNSFNITTIILKYRMWDIFTSDTLGQFFLENNTVLRCRILPDTVKNIFLELHEVLF